MWNFSEIVIGERGVESVEVKMDVASLCSNSCEMEGVE